MKTKKELISKVKHVMALKKDIQLLDVDTVINLVNNNKDKELFDIANEWIIDHFVNYDHLYDYVTKVKRLTKENINVILTRVFSNEKHYIHNMNKFLLLEGCPKDILYNLIATSSKVDLSDILYCIEIAIEDKANQDIIEELTDIYFERIESDDISFEDESDMANLVYLSNLIEFRLSLNSSHNIVKKLLNVLLKKDISVFRKFMFLGYLSNKDVIKVVKTGGKKYLKFGLELLVSRMCSYIHKDNIEIYDACIKYNAIDEIINHIHYFAISIDKIAFDLCSITNDASLIYNNFYKKYYKKLNKDTNDKMIKYFLDKKLYNVFFEQPLIDIVGKEKLIELLPLVKDINIVKDMLFKEDSPFSDSEEIKKRIRYDLLKRVPLKVIDINNIFEGREVEDEFWEELANTLINSKDHPAIVIKNITDFMKFHPNVKFDNLFFKLNLNSNTANNSEFFQTIGTYAFDENQFENNIKNNLLSSFIFKYNSDGLKQLFNYLLKNIDKYSVLLQVYYDFIIELSLNPGVNQYRISKCNILDQEYLNKINLGKSYIKK